ncbi:hypothetical protein MHYP_G00037210 [Metynnis hypsauchen]
MTQPCLPKQGEQSLHQLQPVLCQPLLLMSPTTGTGFSRNMIRWVLLNRFSLAEHQTARHGPYQLCPCPESAARKEGKHSVVSRGSESCQIKRQAESRRGTLAKLAGRSQPGRSPTFCTYSLISNSSEEAA